MLNHFACVGLKRHYFIIWCRGIASTDFRCVSLLKKHLRGKVSTCRFFYRAASENTNFMLYFVFNLQIFGKNLR